MLTATSARFRARLACSACGFGCDTFLGSASHLQIVGGRAVVPATGTTICPSCVWGYAAFTAHPNDAGEPVAPGAVGYRVELANRIKRGRCVGNLYGVARYVDGRREGGWVLDPQLDDRLASGVALVLRAAA